MPGDPPRYVKPVDAAQSRYFEWLEANTHLVYPALAVLAVALIAFGVLKALRSEDMDGLQKAELKRELILELRREVWGMTAERLSRSVGVPALKLLKVLEEMQRDNIVESRTDTSHVTTWRMKGLSSS